MMVLAKYGLVLVCTFGLVIGLTQCANVLQHYNRFTTDVARFCEESGHLPAQTIIRMYEKLYFWCTETSFGCPKSSDLSWVDDLRAKIWVNNGEVGRESLVRHKSIVCDIHLSNLHHYKDNSEQLTALIGPDYEDYNPKDEGLEEAEELDGLLARNQQKSESASSSSEGQNPVEIYTEYANRILDHNCKFFVYCHAQALVKMYLRLQAWCTKTSFGCPEGDKLDPYLARLRHHMWRTYGNVEESELSRFKKVVCQVHEANKREYGMERQ